MSIIKNELRTRARRLIEGRGNFEDIDRLFLEQRQVSHGKEIFREIGDFLAHRDERNKGPVTQRVRDIFTSFRVWSLGFRHMKPTLDDLRSAGLANLRLLEEDEIKKRCGTHREAARTKFEKAVRKLTAGHPLSETDRNLIDLLGNRFFWKPAFTDEVLHRDFSDVLVSNDILTSDDGPIPWHAQRLLTLHAIVRLHGAAIKLEDGRIGLLHAGYANRERYLEIKIDLSSGDWPKPVQVPVCIFWTKLPFDESCDDSLIDNCNMPQWDMWKDPIAVGPDGRLRRLK